MAESGNCPSTLSTVIEFQRAHALEIIIILQLWCLPQINNISMNKKIIMKTMQKVHKYKTKTSTR